MPFAVQCPRPAAIGRPAATADARAIFLSAPGARIVAVPGRYCRRSMTVISRRATVYAHAQTAQSHGHGGNAGPPPKPGSFVEEMRARAMRNHTREQAPKEGQRPTEGVKPVGKLTPTKEGYLQFLVDSRTVYQALESIVAASPADSLYAQFRATGLERTAALDRDIAWFQTSVAVPAPGKAGLEYAELLLKMSKSDPPAFLCHFYNIYFAHTAGGRMIGAQLSDKLLGGHVLEFYKWAGELKTPEGTGLLDVVRSRLDTVSESWSRTDKDRCLDETEASFALSGGLMKAIMGPGH